MVPPFRSLRRSSTRLPQSLSRLTKEQGDAVAAELAGRLAALVEGISRRYAGRPVRWLGDGGMFVFREPAAAVGRRPKW
jgi:class 3 adenylate cyclase